MKLRLSVQNGSLAGREFELEQSALVLGRGKDCNLRFDYDLDPGVSSRHATIRAEQDGFYVVDEQSTNGTLLNGSFIQKSLLHSGDTIQLSSHGPRIRVQIEGMDTVRATQVFARLPQSASPEAGPKPAVASAPAQQPASRDASLMETFSGLTTYNPTKQKDNTRMLGCVAALVVGGFLMLVVMGIMVWQLGFIGAFVGTIMAFTPAPLYLFLLLWIDRYDPEPGWAIAGAFAWGAPFAVLVSIIFNTLFGTAMGSIAGGQQGLTLSSIISAPFFEEGTKGLGVVLILVFMRKEFDGIVDGIFYAGVIALGFATLENVLYYGGTYVQYGFSSLIKNVFDRGLLAPFSHALFTSMTGIGCGVSRETHNKMLRVLAPAVGYVMAMILHGFWNAIASAVGGVGYYIAYLMVWVPLFLIFLAGVLFVAKRERDIIKKMLVAEVADGLITQQQLDVIGSLSKRMAWLLSSSGDMRKLNARRRFLRAVTKLAFSYWHVESAEKEGSRTISLPRIPRFQAEVKDLQDQI